MSGSVVSGSVEGINFSDYEASPQQRARKQLRELMALSLGTAIRHVMNDDGISTTELATAIGSNVPWLKKILSGASLASPEWYDAIAKELGMTREDLTTLADVVCPVPIDVAARAYPNDPRYQRPAEPEPDPDYTVVAD